MASPLRVNHAPVEVHTFFGQVFVFVLHLLSFPFVTPLQNVTLGFQRDPKKDDR